MTKDQIVARRQIAVDRLEAAIAGASERFGVTMPAATFLEKQNPPLFKAERIERLASFIESLKPSAASPAAE